MAVRTQIQVGPAPNAPSVVAALPDYWDARRAAQGKPDTSRCAAELRAALKGGPVGQTIRDYEATIEALRAQHHAECEERLADLCAAQAEAGAIRERVSSLVERWRAHSREAHVKPISSRDMLQACAYELECLLQGCVHEWVQTGGSSSAESIETFERCTRCREERFTETPRDQLLVGQRTDGAKVWPGPLAALTKRIDDQEVAMRALAQGLGLRPESFEPRVVAVLFEQLGLEPQEMEHG